MYDIIPERPLLVPFDLGAVLREEVGQRVDAVRHQERTEERPAVVRQSTMSQI